MILTNSKIDEITKENKLSTWLEKVKEGEYVVVKNKDIFYFFEKLITLPLIQKQIQNPESIIYKMILKYCNKGLDLILYQCIDYEVEQFHHTAWWGVLKITKRPPIILDLYYLHEMTHISNIMSSSSETFDDWKKKMLYEELYASAFSEILVYFDIPELRKQSYKAKKLKGEIFADKLLSDEIQLSKSYGSNKELFEKNRDKFIEELMKLNLKSLYTPPNTIGEKYVFGFRLNNEMWFEIWKNTYEIIEKENTKYLQTKDTSEHLRWLENEANKYQDKIPFSSEAHIFYEYLQARIKASEETIPFSSANDKKTQEFVDLLTYKYGIMKSVILSPVPEITQIIQDFKKTDEGNLLQQETFTYWQDYYGNHLIDLSKRYVSYVSKDIQEYKNGYVFSGSTEAHYKLFMLIKRDGGNLHVLESEYEGYRFVAKDYGVEVIFHKRDTLKESIKKIKKNDHLWLSNPNSMDGNLLKDYDYLMKVCEEKGAKVYVDLVYVGTVAKPFTIDLSYKCIYAVSWSGSKSFPGLFYYRIGVLFTREPYQEFLGTRWFHNMESIRIGLQVLSMYTPFDIPRKYLSYQKKAQKELSKLLNYSLNCSDCVWLLWAKKSPNKRKDLDYFYRPNSEVLRFTISEYIIRRATHYLENQYRNFLKYNVSKIIHLNSKVKKTRRKKKSINKTRRH